MRALGIDTSLRSTGAGIVVSRGTSLRAVEYTTLRVPPGRPVSECLKGIHTGLTELIERTAPQAVAIEGAFFARNARTAMLLGEARGTAISVCALHGLPVYEYAPRRLKQAVTGHGNAAKEQVRSMVMSLLNLAEPPQEDAGDALALAICHLHSRSSHALLVREPI